MRAFSDDVSVTTFLPMIEAEDNKGHGKEPESRVGSGTVHKTVGVSFNGLTAAFCRILMLFMWFTLPIFDTEGAKNILNSCTDLYLSPVTNE